MYIARRRNEQCAQRSGFGRQGKLKRPDVSEVNAMAAKTSVKASLPNLHDKRLCIPQAILEDSTFVIAIINVTFYYSATQACKRTRLEREASGLQSSYNSCSKNAAETILEGLNYKIFLDLPCERAMCAFMRSAYCWKPPLRSLAYARVYV